MNLRAAASACSLAFLLGGCNGGGPGLLTAEVARATISQTVSATGNLAPQDTILVGSQVSGTIQKILVDYNSPVHTGQVLAQLDPSTFQAALDQAQSTLAQVQAQGASSAANAASALYSSSASNATAHSQQTQIAAADWLVKKSQSTLALAELTDRRDRALLRDGYVAQNVVDADDSAIATAKAALVAATTAAASARLTTTAGEDTARSSAASATAAQALNRANDAAVRAAQAAVEQARLNLQHATIVSPVDGTVVARNVSVGQTVAAALQAPTLFTIAKDLGKMELDIAVGEPDVGYVRAGQHVRFTVLAYPGRAFDATVAQVRQNPTVTNNVTTYTTVAYADNRRGLLRPGMTANVTLDVATFRDALVVPLAALQWRPSAGVRKHYTVTAPSAAPSPASARSVWGNTTLSVQNAVSVGGNGRLYVLDGRALRGVVATVLAIEGTNVAVRPVAGDLAPGMPVVIDEAGSSAAAGTPPP